MKTLSIVATLSLALLALGAAPTATANYIPCEETIDGPSPVDETGDEVCETLDPVNDVITVYVCNLFPTDPRCR